MEPSTPFSSSKREADPVTGDEQDAKKLKIDEQDANKLKIDEEEKEEREKFEEACDRIRAKYTDETEIRYQISMYRLDHLSARTRAETTEEELRDMCLERHELKLSSEERTLLFLERDRSSDVDEGDDGPDGPDYPPDDPLPPGYRWASIDPCTHPDLKDVVIPIRCARCFGTDHITEACTDTSPSREW